MWWISHIMFLYLQSWEGKQELCQGWIETQGSYLINGLGQGRMVVPF